MLQKPKFLIPGVNMYGKSVIDLNDTKAPFSCIVDGNEAVVSWQIEIFKLSNNSKVFDSGKIDLSEPFYPINNKNQNVVFEVDLKDYYSGATVYRFDASGTEYNSQITYYRKSDDQEYTGDGSNWNSVRNSYYYLEFINTNEPFCWHIILWGRSGDIVTSCDEVFYANSTPETAIYYSYDNKFLDNNNDINSDLVISDGETFEKRKIYFKATYAQSDGVSLKRYGWRVTDIVNNVVIMDTITHNQIYGVEDDISCFCEGLVDDASYLLELYIETQNGFFGVVNSLNFAVDYETQDLGGDISVEADNNISGVVIDFGNLNTTEGVVKGKDIRYVDGYPISNSVSIDIPENSSVVFKGNANGKELEIDENSYIVLSFQIKKDKSEMLFTAKGTSDTTGLPIERKLAYNASSNALEYEYVNDGWRGGNTQHLSYVNGERCWYVAILEPNGFWITESQLDDSTVLFPSNNLFPSDDTFPLHGTWRKIGHGNGGDTYVEDPWGDIDFLEDEGV